MIENMCDDGFCTLRRKIVSALMLFTVVFASLSVNVTFGAEKKNADDTAIAFDGRIIGDASSTRLLIDLDREVDLRPFYMNNPPRLVIDISKTAFRFSNPKNLEPRGLVAGLRYGTMARGNSRVVISLSAPVKIVNQSMQELAAERFRFTLDFEATSDREFLQQIEDQRNIIGKSGNVATKGDRIRPPKNDENRITIVIDPGHGGIDGGANGAKGSVEKEITLAAALQLEEALKADGKFDVYLTRREDHFMSLKERVQFTIRKRADLFISIHADTLGQKDVRGATVYTLSKKASDELSKKLAENENRADLIAGLSTVEVKNEVADILVDLAARETKRFSVRFAKKVVSVLKDEILLIKNPHRYAAFGVLKDPNVPSVLLELGYLSNPEDEKLLLSHAWRAKFARHLTQSIKQYFSDRH